MSIPKIIIQTWKNKNLPNNVNTLINKLKSNNPHYNYLFFF